MKEKAKVLLQGVQSMSGQSAFKDWIKLVQDQVVMNAIIAAAEALGHLVCNAWYIWCKKCLLLGGK